MNKEKNVNIYTHSSASSLSLESTAGIVEDVSDGIGLSGREGIFDVMTASGYK